MKFERYSLDKKTIYFTCYLRREEAINGTLIATVRPSFDYTRIYNTVATTTYLRNLRAQKKFEYIVWSVPDTEAVPVEEVVEEIVIPEVIVE